MSQAPTSPTKLWLWPSPLSVLSLTGSKPGKCCTPSDRQLLEKLLKHLTRIKASNPKNETLAL